MCVCVCSVRGCAGASTVPLGDAHVHMQVLACIGEQFTEGDEVCGVAVNIRGKGDRIDLWTKTAANEAAQVRRLGAAGCGGAAGQRPAAHRVLGRVAFMVRHKAEMEGDSPVWFAHTAHAAHTAHTRAQVTRTHTQHTQTCHPIAMPFPAWLALLRHR